MNIASERRAIFGTSFPIFGRRCAAFFGFFACSSCSSDTSSNCFSWRCRGFTSGERIGDSRNTSGWRGSQFPYLRGLCRTIFSKRCWRTGVEGVLGISEWVLASGRRVRIRRPSTLISSRSVGSRASSSRASDSCSNPCTYSTINRLVICWVELISWARAEGRRGICRGRVIIPGWLRSRSWSKRLLSIDSSSLRGLLFLSSLLLLVQPKENYSGNSSHS